MKKMMVAGNWKMNMLRYQAKELTQDIISGLIDVKDDIDIVLAPPFTALDVVSGLIGNSRVMLAAQNVFWEDRGAFTGEISPAMLVDAGCKWVIIGHSERRGILGETDSVVRKKIKASLSDGLNVIVCVGETLQEREVGKTIKIVQSQVESALMDLELDDPQRFVIAYEPVWAIGTGKNATPKEAEDVHATIREITGSIFAQDSELIRIIYGGSVNGDNIEELLHMENIDGALIGGAGLDADSFVKIVKIAGE
ncbi:MAG: triose-phosphate isomerase [Candidatus Dadabacteria bacterium]|jgi:triosephosphate isomerase|nr:triose-phosphate isomerase [Candidatus Dadabacteria bacterium]